MATVERRHLLWQCRRGTRETGLLLERFMHHCYDTLSSAERDRLSVLLGRTEPELLSLLTGQAAAPDARTERLLRLIRMHGQPEDRSAAKAPAQGNTDKP